MQEQRGTIGSFPGSLDLNHASTSITAVDQQLCWNNMQNAAEDHLADCIVAPDDIGITYINPVGQERQNPRRWCLGEPSSSGVHNQTNLDEQRRDYRCSASVGPCTSNGPSLGEQFSESTATVPFNGVNRHPVMTRRSNLDAATPSINLNEEYIIPVANNHAHNACKSTGTGNEQMQPGGSSVPSYPSGSGGYLVEETDNRISASAEGRRASCKRKLPEGVVGQASGSGSCSYVQSAETSAWSSAPANYNAPSEQLNTGINVCPRGLSFDSPQDLAITGNIDSSYRNVRMRVHPSSQPDSVPQPLFPTGSVVRPYSYPSSQQLPRPFPVNNSLDSRSASVAGRTISQNQPVVFQVPAVPRNLQPFSASGASASRPGNSSNSAVSGNIDAPQERTSSRNVGRGIREHLRFTPSNELMRNIVPNPTNRSVVSGNIRGPGHVMSAQAASSSVIPSAAPSGAYHAGTPSRSSRRLTEYVRRSLFPSAGSDSGGQSSNSSLHSGPSSQEMLLPSATSNQDHLQSSSRLGSWMERQGDRVLSIPLRTLPTFREGRRGRLVSEVSVLNLFLSILFASIVHLTLESCHII